MKNYSNKIIGIWKFNSNVSPENLVELAERWSKDDPKYDRLYVRKVSKDQHGIGFEYIAYEDTDADADKNAYDGYLEKTSDKLKREFGNDWAGWDISARSYIIK